MLGTSHLPEVAFQVKIFQKILKFILESSGKKPSTVPFKRSAKLNGPRTQKLEQRYMFSQYLLLQLNRRADILLFKKGMQMRLIRICNA